MPSLVREFRDQFDLPLFVAVAGVAALGLVNLYSATSAEGPAIRELYVTQLYWLALGSAAAVVVAMIDYRHYERYGYIAYAVGLVLLILVFLIGNTVRGSMRWIPIGAFNLQPSELMKIFLILALAKYLHNDPKTEGRRLVDLIVPALIVLPPMALILLQPDLGTAVIVALIFGTIMVLTKLRIVPLLVLGGVFALSAPLTWTYLLQQYQRDRLVAFMDPEHDITGIGYHAHQSRVAIGSGGFWGKGYLEGTQNQHGFLPDQYSDFPFAVWGEEHGLVGAAVLLLLYLFLILWGLKIASQAKDRFGAVVAVGVSAMIFWQAVINIGMVMGLLPIVGITLPFFSYGGSSVLTMLIGIGLLMNVSLRRFHF
jgi:rod shape determining protein RodA